MKKVLKLRPVRKCSQDIQTGYIRSDSTICLKKCFMVVTEIISSKDWFVNQWILKVLLCKERYLIVRSTCVFFEKPMYHKVT